MDPNQQSPPPNQDQRPAQPSGGSDSTPKQSLVARVQQANNVLVTVRSNPSVDELAATIGLTLMLNKLGKHTTAVFSGAVPSTLEFLKPEETLESNTDSLRDFIVSLDKSKADKLRYKVEENVVKIFITPYRTSISQDDLEFTQGDFNVDVVLALGVTQREELDQAIMAHGRILHDATVVTVTAGQDHSELGQINWQETGASSLSEMLVSVSEAFKGGLIDEQIATAFLTGIVSETERFSNPKTSPKVMTMAAQLMAAGANQQLIANELEKAVEVDISEAGTGLSPEAPAADSSSVGDDGSLSIAHDEPEQPVPELPAPAATEPSPPAEPLLPPSEQTSERFLSEAHIATSPPDQTLESVEPLMSEPSSEPEVPQSPPEPEENKEAEIHIDTEGNMVRKSAQAPKHKVIEPLPATEKPAAEDPAPAGHVLPPSFGSSEEDSAAASAQAAMPVNIDDVVSKLPPPPSMDMTPPGPIQDSTTLSQIEQAVHSPHAQGGGQAVAEPAAEVDSARSAVDSALAGAGFNPAGQARSDLNAMPLGKPPAPTPYDSYRLDSQGPVAAPPNDVSGNLPSPEQPQQEQESGKLPPPPVPPPMMPR